MKMEKLFGFMVTIALLLMVAPQVMKAANEVETLIVLMKNGTETAFFLQDKPKVTFEGTNLKVSATSGDVTFALADVQRFTYEMRSSTGISEQVAESTAVTFDDGILVVSQLKANSSVSVYALDGKLIRHLKPQRTGTYRLNLSELPTGLYLVKADNITYKITKR